MSNNKQSIFEMNNATYFLLGFAMALMFVFIIQTISDYGIKKELMKKEKHGKQ